MFISGTCKVPLGSVLSKHWALPEFLPQSSPIHPQTCITYITCSSCIFCITYITCISCIPCITFITEIICMYYLAGRFCIFCISWRFCKSCMLLQIFHNYQHMHQRWLTLSDPGWADLPPPAQKLIPVKKITGGNSDNSCILIYVY